MARIVKATPDAITEAARLLAAGHLVAFPTETVYGLGAAARSPEAVTSIYDLKGRPKGHPLIVHLPDPSHVERWASAVPQAVGDLAQAFWPGPLTLVLNRAADVTSVVTGGQETVALRCPRHPVAQALLAAFGDGVAAPSANRFGHVSPTTAEHVAADFVEELLVLDGGPCEVGLESTILDVSALALGQRPRLLRPGGVAVADLERVLGGPVALPGDWGGSAPRVPGSLRSHYAAKAPTRLVTGQQLEALAVAGQLGDRAVMAFAPRPAGAGSLGRWLQMPSDPVSYARALYAGLRLLDAHEPQSIIIEEVPQGQEWAAVRDRLQRATADSGVER